jgi:hypothetical protein
MTAAIEYLKLELAKAEKALEEVTRDTKRAIQDGDRARRELNDAIQIVSELKAAIATLTPKSEEQLVAAS